MIKSYAPASASRRYSADFEDAGRHDRRPWPVAWPAPCPAPVRAAHRPANNQHAAGGRVVDRGVADVVLAKRVVRHTVKLVLAVGPTSRRLPRRPAEKRRPSFRRRALRLRASRNRPSSCSSTMTVCGLSVKFATWTNACCCSVALVATRRNGRDRQVLRIERSHRHVHRPQLAERHALDVFEPAVAEDVRRRGRRLGRSRSSSLLARCITRPGSANPLASSSAPARSVPRAVGLIDASRSRSSRRLDVNSCTTCGLSAKLMIIADMPESIWSTSPSASCFASASRSRRVGASVAAMLAELSTRNMNRWPSSRLPCQPGRNSARIASPTSSSCRNISRFSPQPLPQAVHMQVFDRPLPKISARHLERHSLELQENRAR